MSPLSAICSKMLPAFPTDLVEQDQHLPVGPKRHIRSGSADDSGKSLIATSRFSLVSRAMKHPLQPTPMALRIS
jgi:hypothetical protein